MMRFKKPLVANAHMLTKESLKVEPGAPVYITVAWMKPGRHTYAIKYEPDGTEKRPSMQNVHSE